MGTRGLWGFKYNNQYKVTYSHSDSYFEELGLNILNLIHSAKTDEKLIEIYNRICQLNDADTIDLEDLKILKEKYNASFDMNTYDYYTAYYILKDFQTRPDLLLNEDFYYILDYNTMYLSLHKDENMVYEYRYLIDLDKQVLLIHSKELENNKEEIPLNSIFNLHILFPDNKIYKNALLLGLIK